MAAYTYDAINAEGLRLRGEIHAADPTSAREQLRPRGLLARTLRERAASGEGAGGAVQAGQAEVAAGLLPAARDDDRGRGQRGLPL